MTVMSRMEAKREKHRDEVSDLIPDPIARARAVLEDLRIPAEAEAMGLDDKEDVIAVVLDEVLDELDDAPVPRDARHFVEEEKEMAKDRIPALVHEEFDAEWL